MQTEERRCWYNAHITAGLGPAAAQLLALGLERSGLNIVELASMSSADSELATGLRPKLAESLQHQLADPAPLPAEPDGTRLLLPSDDLYPVQRQLTANPPLPLALWVAGDASLLSTDSPSLGVSGSRDAAQPILDHVERLAHSASSAGWIVVSGGARGVDTAAHRGAILGGTGTIAVLACGISANPQPLPDDVPAVIVSEFHPTEPWSGPRAMQRNSTIAALSDRVVIASAGTKGGTWEMGQLCLKRKKSLYVLDFPELEGNQRLISSGARGISPDDADLLHDPNTPAETLFD